MLKYTCEKIFDPCKNYSINENLIKYEGQWYNITYDMNTGIVTTNHPKREKYIKDRFSQFNMEYDKNARLMRLAYCFQIRKRTLDPFIFKIYEEAPIMFFVLTDYGFLMEIGGVHERLFERIVNIIVLIKENFDIVKKWQTYERTLIIDDIFKFIEMYKKGEDIRRYYNIKE